MKFTFDEAELFNSVLETQGRNITKEELISLLHKAKKNSDDDHKDDIAVLVDNLTGKMEAIGEDRYIALMNELPVVAELIDY